MEKKEYTMKEYTINVDVAIKANTIEEAIRKLAKQIKSKYWIGEIKEED